MVEQNRNGIALDTPAFPWHLMRGLGSEDQAAATNLASANMDASEVYGDHLGSGAQVADGGGYLFSKRVFGRGLNSLEICFFTDSDAANDTFGFELWKWRAGKFGQGIKVFDTTLTACIIGTQVCKTHPTLGTPIVVKLNYATFTTVPLAGDTLTQATTNAEMVVVSTNTAKTQVIGVQTVAAFNESDNVTSDDAGANTMNPASFSPDTVENGLWCDTISGTDYWDNVEIEDSAADRICCLKVSDCDGYDVWRLILMGLGAGGTECASVGAIVSGK